MNFSRFSTLPLAAFVLLCLPLAAQQPATDPRAVEERLAIEKRWRDASVEELVAALNRLADESIQREHALTDRERMLQKAWLDPAHTSEKIAGLRTRIQELENELIEARRALQDAVFALPALHAERDAAETERREVDALKGERRFVQQLLQERRQAGRK